MFFNPSNLTPFLSVLAAALQDLTGTTFDPNTPEGKEAITRRVFEGFQNEAFRRRLLDAMAEHAERAQEHQAPLLLDAQLHPASGEDPIAVTCIAPPSV